MDILKDEKTLEYTYNSRYATFPVYYNVEDKKYMYGITGHLNDNISYVEYKIMPGDTLDSLADIYYGRPDYYWIIADFNKITDPFITLEEYYSTIKIPSLANVSFKK